MSLQGKRKVFFVFAGALFTILFLMVMWQPFLTWADSLTMQGVMILGIPFSQFILLFSTFSMAILITVVFYVDTKVLAVKSKDL